ncbi:MAG TPA: rhodanese-like domain-containing protein [Phycisphaerales bacterium]|nr:rhodanese-like domain-containing protein [Phycisphaerales bacterium]
MFLRMLYDDHLAQAAYVIGCQRTGEAIVIDPERDVDRYIELAQANGLRIVAATETHIHADFLSGTRELAERVGARVYLSGEGGSEWSYGWLDKKAGGGRYDAVLLKNGDTFRIGNIELRAVHTPGHTPEHVMFIVTDLGGGATEPMGIATGDFVFVGDLGRPDLLESAAGEHGVKEGFARTLNASAVKFLELPDYLQVWPAHGAGSACGKALGAVPSSTVGYERKFNSSLRLAGKEQDFVSFILSGQPAPPLYFARMKRENRDGVPLLGELPRPRRIAGAELAVLDGRQVAIVDTRPWPAFRDGHVPGSLWAPIGTQFPMVTGSYIEPDEEIVLVCEPEQAEMLVRDLVRIGLDRVVGFGAPSDVSGAAHLERTPEISAVEFADRMRGQAPFVLDARNEHEHAEGGIEGAMNIAHTRLAPRIGELPKARPIVCHCRSGVRSGAATAYLRREGYDVTNLAGGFLAWERAGGEVVKPGAEAAAR